MSLSNQDIKKAMLSQSPDWDKQALWDDISKTLDQPKKKRVAGFWIWSAGLAIVGLSVLMAFVLMEQKAAETNQTNNQVTVDNKTVAINSNKTRTNNNQKPSPPTKTTIISENKPVASTLQESSFKNQEKSIISNTNHNKKHLDKQFNNPLKTKPQIADTTFDLLPQKAKTIPTNTANLSNKSPISNLSSTTTFGGSSILERNTPITDQLTIAGLKSNETAFDDQKVDVHQNETPVNGMPIPSKAAQVIQRNIPITPSLLPENTKSKSNSLETSKWEFILGFGANKAAHNYNYTDLVLGEFAKPGFRVARLTSWEFTRRLTTNFKLRSGILFFQKSYKTKFPSGGSSTRTAYNFSIPIMLQYERPFKSLIPYIAMGVGIDKYDEIGLISGFGSTTLGYGIQSTTPAVGWRLSGQFELGSHFHLFKQKFSVALLGNLSNGKTYNSDYLAIKGADIEELVGNGYSTGNTISLRLRYHLPLDGEQSVFNSLKGLDRFKASDSNKGKGLNELGIELSSFFALYSIYYERTLFKRQNWWLSFRQGFSYIPSINGNAQVINNDPDAIKLEGLFIPNSILVYLGKSKNFQIGYKQNIQYSPYANPQPDGSLRTWDYSGMGVLGVKFRIKRFAFNAQLNPMISKNFKGKWNLFYGVGLSGGYRF